MFSLRILNDIEGKEKRHRKSPAKHLSLIHI